MHENRSIDQYSNIVGQNAIHEIKELANRLEGGTITHINTARRGGGVAEILKNLVPLANSVGLKAKWHVMGGPPDFFGVTKAFHKALQGKELSLSDSMKEIYVDNNERYEKGLNLDSDVVIIHDPQPAPLINFIEHEDKKVLWRCHIDIADAVPAYWNFLKQFVDQYDALIFSLERYLREDVRNKKYFVVSPSIDPLSDKNKHLSPDRILETLRDYDIDPERPIITQISRFDYFKDPLGVIDCYKIVKETIPEAQLILAGNIPQDDPEGEQWLEKTKQKAEGLNDVHIFSHGIDDLEVNCIQRGSSVILQKSLREGFGLTVTEALWKGTPVVATRTGGIPLQVIDGITGFLVDNINETAQRVIQLLKQRFLAKHFGIKGREHIKRNFLITRHLRDYLKIHLEMLS
ncbi:MAG: glycosyltransferase [Thermoproteota archaeon]